MACTQERSHALGELALGTLDAEASAELLTHLDGCGECSRELDLLADLARLDEAAAHARPALRPALRGARVWFPLAAAAGLFLVVLVSREPGTGPLAELADLRPPPAAPHTLRSSQSHSPDYSRGLEHYARAEWRQAARRFDAHLATEPDHPLARFYLSVAELQQDVHGASGEAALERLGELATEARGLLAEDAWWTKANGHLARDEAEAARAALDSLLALDGDYAPNARALLEELQALTRE